jgi:hypothetical protein
LVHIKSNTPQIKKNQDTSNGRPIRIWLIDHAVQKKKDFAKLRLKLILAVIGNGVSIMLLLCKSLIHAQARGELCKDTTNTI